VDYEKRRRGAKAHARRPFFFFHDTDARNSMLASGRRASPLTLNKKMNFLFDLAQEVRTRAAESSAERAREKAADAAGAAVDLRRRIEVMALANQALFEILKSRLGISEEEVMLRMAEIDVRDGSKDGKMSARVASCRRCGRKISTARQRCMFCGEVVVDGHLFQKT
jgi:hypothetical protein